MLDEESVRHIVQLSDPATRMVAASAIGAGVGAEALMAFVVDSAVGSLVPVVGFAKTLPGGAGWRQFLDEALRTSPCSGIVAYPDATDEAMATGWTVGSTVFVFLGRGCDSARVELLLPVLPPIARLFASEHDARAARGELRAAQDHARHAETLARALDAAREDVARGMRDVHRQTQALKDAHAKAEQAARAKDEFLAMLGHELRNPLAPIVTALQLLRLRNATGREHEVIERQVANMMRLVDDLLDVSRITRGRVELRREAIELSSLVAEAVETASGELQRKHQHLQVSVARTGLPIEADRSRLIQVITNLLTNASKYSDARTEIRISGSRIGDRVRLAVSDAGIGLPPEMLERVFHLFVQTPQALDRTRGGLGLGLAIVRSLVELHGGRVWAESPGPGGGSTFTIDLPATTGSPAQTEPAGESLMPVEAGSHRLHRILVVDDNEDARVMLADALTALGHDVRTAADGPTAISIARHFHPDAALLDIGLPVMDGYELAMKLREVDNGVTLVAVTGYGQESDRQRASRAGFDVHLVKPVSVEDVARALEQPDSPTVLDGGL